MADQDHASTESASGKVLNPIPVTRPRDRRERPAGLAFDVEQGADLPGVPAGDQTPKNPGAVPAQEMGGGVGLAFPETQPGRKSRQGRRDTGRKHGDWRPRAAVRPETGAGLKRKKEGLTCSRLPISVTGGATT